MLYGNRAVLGLGFIVLSEVSACTINSKSNDAYPEPEGVTVCEEYCRHWMNCGTFVSAAAFEECQSTCEDAYSQDSHATTQAASCVEHDSCRPLDESSCRGAPPVPTTDRNDTYPPPSGSGGESAGGTANPPSAGGAPVIATGGAGGTNGSGGTRALAPDAGTPLSGCVANRDCALSEDCVSGLCLQRCNASCECRSGETCEAGYCHAAVPPPATCQTDCDCPAAHRCISGVCE